MAGKRAQKSDIQGSASNAENIPRVLGMQSGLNSVSMAVGAMEKALYSSYTLPLTVKLAPPAPTAACQDET